MLRSGEAPAQRPAARLRRVRLAFAVAAHLSVGSGRHLESDFEKALGHGTMRI